MRKSKENQEWILKPSNLQNPSPIPSTSHQILPNRAIPTSNFIPNPPKPRRNRRKNNWVSHNQGFSAVKSRDFDESQVGFVDLGKGESGKQQNVEIIEGSCVNGDGNEGCDSIGDEGDCDDFVRRLEELELGAQEPELCEEQLRINDQSQEDELLAMESIYGDAFTHNRQRSLRSFQLLIHIEILSDLMVTAKLNSPRDLTAKSDGSTEFSYSFKVNHLPPIILTCLLPKSYPSHRSPYFTISVQWLAVDEILSLCSMLDSIWTDQPGQEVLYPWVEWLSNSSLSHLGFEKEIILSPFVTRHAGDRRAISGSVSPDVDIPFLKSFNDEKKLDNFAKSLHQCCICFSEYAGTNFAQLPCQHFFCCNCTKTYCEMHVKEGTVMKLRCPDPKCGGTFPPSLLKRLLGDEEFKRWESLMLLKTLDSMSDVAYCPRCDTACLEDEEQHAQCSKCFFSFCTLCRDRRHVGIECMTADHRLLILQERQNSSHLKDRQKKKELEMINELLSVKEILRDSKLCPSCNMAISRTEGCNKMVCDNCGQYFCYRCNKPIEGYDHFRDGECELFPQEMISEWEQRINARQVLGQAQAELFADHGLQCPICRQYNPKVGNNNHIFCWACQSHYCYLCRKIVRHGSQHFGPKGCKQHTVG